MFILFLINDLLYLYIVLLFFFGLIFLVKSGFLCLIFWIFLFFIGTGKLFIEIYI